MADSFSSERVAVVDSLEEKLAVMLTTSTSYRRPPSGLGAIGAQA
jgi:hypothetical protein